MFFLHINIYNKTVYVLQYAGLVYKCAQHATDIQPLSACKINTDYCRYGSNTQWAIFRDARFEDISAKISALRELTPCNLINKYQRLEESAAFIFRA
jgi:hypothetical protein